MGAMHEVAKAVGKAAGNVHAGVEKMISRSLGTRASRTIDVTSPMFHEGARLPVEATVDGRGSAPAIAWSEAPVGTKSIVVVAEDPDAPFPQPFVHWMVYGIPSDGHALDSDVVLGYRQGKNSKLGMGYTAAAPPPGHGLHRYHFQVFALDIPIEDEPGLGRGTLIRRMRGHVLGWGELVGVYERR